MECGLTHQEIADDLCVSASAVTSLKRHIKKHGHIFPVRPPGNTPTLCKDDYPIIRRIVAEKPDLILQDYAKEISRETGKPLLSTPTICRVLKKLNLRLKKKSRYAAERDRPEIKKKVGLIH